MDNDGTPVSADINAPEIYFADDPKLISAYLEKRGLTWQEPEGFPLLNWAARQSKMEEIQVRRATASLVFEYIKFRYQIFHDNDKVL